MRKAGLFDLEENVALFGAYHGNPIKRSDTFFFVPMGQVLNFGLLVTLAYGLYHVNLDRKAGSLACWVGANLLATKLGFSLSCKVLLLAHFFSWTGRSAGHRLFDEREPVLSEHPQGAAMAPFFILFEVLPGVFGYDPIQDFMQA